MTSAQIIASLVSSAAGIWTFEAIRHRAERQTLVAFGIFLIAAMVAGGEG